MRHSRESEETAMFLFRKLSTPGGAPKKTHVIELVIVSLIAQSCTAVSGLSEKNDQSLTLPQVSGETNGGDSNIQKASTGSDSRKTKQAGKHKLSGLASWYGPGFHGKKTASGEIYDQNKLTAAHKTLPLGSKARVTNLDNGNAVEVEINDRGPFVEGRVIDLSRAAAGALGIVKSGTVPVQVELISASSN